MSNLNFKTLQSSYSAAKISGGCGKYGDQCAMRMSGALRRSGMNLSLYKDSNTCYDEDNKIHVRGAESLANHLWSNQAPAKKYPSADAAKAGMKGKTGIVLFKDIPNYQGGTGDHIDLWDGTSTTDGHFHNSKEVWFWFVK